MHRAQCQAFPSTPNRASRDWAWDSRASGRRDPYWSFGTRCASFSRLEEEGNGGVLALSPDAPPGDRRHETCTAAWPGSATFERRAEGGAGTQSNPPRGGCSSDVPHYRLRVLIDTLRRVWLGAQRAGLTWVSQTYAAGSMSGRAVAERRRLRSRYSPACALGALQLAGSACAPGAFSMAMTVIAADRSRWSFEYRVLPWYSTGAAQRCRETSALHPVGAKAACTFAYAVAATRWGAIAMSSAACSESGTRGGVNRRGGEPVVQSYLWSWELLRVVKLFGRLCWSSLAGTPGLPRSRKIRDASPFHYQGMVRPELSKNSSPERPRRDTSTSTTRGML